HVRLVLAVTAAVAVIAVAIDVVRRRERIRRLVRDGSLSDRDRGIAAVTIVVAITFVALATSSNMGDYFSFPAFTLGVAGVVAAVHRRGGRLARGEAVVAVLAASANLVLVGRVDVGAVDPMHGSEPGPVLFGGVQGPTHMERWAEV